MASSEAICFGLYCVFFFKKKDKSEFSKTRVKDNYKNPLLGLGF